MVSLQFAMVPLNLLRGRPGADYINTGSWSTKAIKEAQRFCNVNVAASSEADNFSSIPERDSWRLDPDAAYVHIALNETIGGVEFHEVPDVGQVPLVADASSTILSRPLDVNRFGVIYAGAQKNLGPAGLTLVIVHRDLLGGAAADIPSMFDWAVHAAAGSMSNTPPTYAWYLAGLVLRWIRDEGGLVAMAERNAAKAAALYAAIDNSNFYSAPVAVPNRSRMNVPFTLADPALDADFLAGAEQARLLNLGGHRSVGGMRASLYNAVPQAAVDALIEYMQDFESRRG